ncbi:SAP domain containing ribonucleoprotein S homeolog isoform X1 [Xenopus laevis]|uniref:SAP domain containing ribonucleoprotein S homeolog isoform X1 n=1 Tax=Xenopus laevis TaxID=8355 RepID=A0A8J0UHN8_XENLA|nr:SAP domain containing ribonucleoprotein S homeolog isoform X1 [Xenopus laevis]
MADTVELHKLKLVELKQECLARGLEVKGNKSDLISRLQAYLEEHGSEDLLLNTEEEANEEDVLGEETEEEEQKSSVAATAKEEEPDDKPTETNADKKLVKIPSGLSETDKLQKRAERFNVPASADTKKAARAIRFGISTSDKKGQISDVKSSVSMDKLKERAQRFGLSVSPVSKKNEDDEKLKKRKERFGIVTSSASGTDDTEAKKRKRSERFGIV